MKQFLKLMKQGFGKIYNNLNYKYMSHKKYLHANKELEIKNV